MKRSASSSNSTSSTASRTSRPPRRRASSSGLSTLREERSTGSGSGSGTGTDPDSPDDDEQDLREPYEKFANHADGDGSDGDHSFGGPAHYLPLIVAIVPPLGAVLHGRAEAWTDALILLIVAFYLYQVVRLPWEIYYAARTRRISAAAVAVNTDDSTTPETVIKRRQAAASELRQTELLSLLFCIASPFLGSQLLYYIKSALSDPERYINPFNIRLFVLASGVKPWMHFFRLVKRRTLFLQSEAHYPVPTVALLLKRVRVLETELDSLRSMYATKADVKLLRDGVDVPLTALSKAVRRYERKEEYARLSNEDKFQLLMQRQEDMLAEIEASAKEVDEMRLQQEKVGSGMRALRYVFSGAGGPSGNDRSLRVWYERGPFFYVFLPLIASNKILDATGRLFDTLGKQIGSAEHGGFIEASISRPSGKVATLSVPGGLSKT